MTTITIPSWILYIVLVVLIVFTVENVVATINTIKTILKLYVPKAMLRRKEDPR